MVYSRVSAVIVVYSRVTTVIVVYSRVTTVIIVETRITVIRCAEAVAHAEVVVVVGLESVLMSIVEAVSAIAVPTVSASVCDIYCGASEIVERASRIASINAKVPASSSPIKRSVEIRSSAESIQLPVEENVSHVKIASCPVDAV